MAGKLALWRRIGKVVTVPIGFLFFLPFFGISCEGMDVYTVSGAAMVGGCRPGGLLAETTDGAPKRGREGGRLDVNLPDVKVSPVAIAALACAVAGVVLAWGRSRRALLGSFAVASTGVVLLVVLYVTTLSALEGGAEDMLKLKGDENSRGLDLSPSRMDKAKPEIGSRFGFWATSAAFIGVAILTGLALREREEAVAGVPGEVLPPGPPGPPPPA